MSGQPSADGVGVVVEMLGLLADLESEVAELTPRVNALSARLENARAELVSVAASLAARLRQMDVDGNCGWERRLAWFLAEFRRQVLAGSVGAPDLAEPGVGG